MEYGEFNSINTSLVEYERTAKRVPTMKTLGGKTPANNSDSLVDNSSDNGAACGNNNGFFTANEKLSSTFLLL